MAASEPAATPSIRDRVRLGARQAALSAAAAWIAYESSAHIGLKEGYWAAISSIVVMQADLTHTKTAGRDRLIGTAIGSLIGWGCALIWMQSGLIYAAGVGLSIFLCWLAGLDNAGRLAGVALTVIMLIPRASPIWQIAVARFLEVSWGIVVTVVLVLCVDRLARRMALPSHSNP